ncbi:hypothetical protein JQX08_01780 [Pseudomonas sp. UL073]|uniref:Alginate biosynthesis protein AlgX n=1 Tax=Zestomonas insulae TaxID=2809017 RepID=A0ABS2I8F3_9GAMM|nr:alginate biosynthesis protein AlgX [Pseudomonas insulae]MBM7059426.1 hypothetical protein [Pseudomonas insulae]
MKTVHCASAWGLALGLGLSLTTAAQAAPEYRAEACCQLCPAAADANQYLAPGLATYRRLITAQDDWLFRSESDLRTRFGLDEQGYKQLKRLRNALKHAGVELMVIYPPSRGLLHADKLNPAERNVYDQAAARRDYLATLDHLRNLDIWVPNMTSLLDAPAGGSPYYFKGDVYWTPRGAERTAQLAADTARGIPALKSLPAQTFVSRPMGMVGRNGGLYRAAAQICGAGYPSQFVERYSTTLVSGETPQPSRVVLVGSGNSGVAFNFSGFLEQYLGTPVSNATLDGGGYEYSLLHYLASDSFRKAPPALLIWELDDTDALLQRNFYRQAIPAVADGCNGRPALLQNHAQLKAGANQVLFNGADGVHPIRGSDYRLDLQFDDPSVQQLTAVLTFMNGRQENLNLTQPANYRGTGRFQLELREDADWDELTFLSLEVQQPAGTASGLSARLCNAQSDAAPVRVAHAEAP